MKKELIKKLDLYHCNEDSDIQDINYNIIDNLLDYIDIYYYSKNDIKLNIYVRDLIFNSDNIIKYINIPLLKSDDYHYNLNSIIDNMLDDIKPIASNGSFTIHDVIHGIEDRLLIYNQGWSVVDINYYDNTSFSLHGVEYSLNEFIKL